LARLEHALAAGRAGVALPDLGLPTGGLCGWVDYDGRFTFGVYQEMLVHCHQAGSWTGCGALAGELGEPPPPPNAVRLGEFRAMTRPEEFLSSVRKAQDWIAAGDIYQVNLSQAFAAGVDGGSLFDWYEILRDSSSAPMAAWLSLNGREVLSSSPELFLRLSDRLIETRPIKGTRPRHAEPESDSRLAYELQTSAKEIAELVMITDLLRNDLGQVCNFGSVRVDDMLRLERLAQVHHLVSTVTGCLRDDVSHPAALAACFPGGSITGAPKKRAMEIIAALESVPRGLYCGAIGYFGFGGESQFSIAIRTLVREGHHLSYHVGAGIVADSVPEREFEETLHKAEGIRLAVERGYAAGCLLRSC
jgi:anthranilate/para-aminobenzoate synthase component I